MLYWLLYPLKEEVIVKKLGDKWELLGLGLVIAGINILGALCLFVGLFAALPTTLLAYAFVYRKLLGQVAEPAPQETATE